MSNRTPTRKERLRRAYESAERTKNQWDNANNVYKDVRDVITREDHKMDDDFIWPEAIERWSAETINLEEEAKAWEKEVKRLKEINMRYDQEIERLEDEIQSSQLTDDEPDNITQHRKLHIPESSTTTEQRSPRSIRTTKEIAYLKRLLSEIFFLPRLKRMYNCGETITEIAAKSTMTSKRSTGPRESNSEVLKSKYPRWRRVCELRKKPRWW